MTKDDKKLIIKFINGEKTYWSKLIELYDKVYLDKTNDPYVRYIQEYFGDIDSNKSEFLKYKRIILKN